jgi:hypothetical protein
MRENDPVETGEEVVSFNDDDIAQSSATVLSW